MDIVTRKHLNVLIQLASADKHFATIEREHIYKIAKAKGFDEKEVKKLILNPEPMGSFGALSEDQRYEYLYSCIHMMLIDKKIFEREITFCQDIAIKLGFKKSVVEYMNEQMDQMDSVEMKKAVFNKFS